MNCDTYMSGVCVFACLCVRVRSGAVLCRDGKTNTTPHKCVQKAERQLQYSFLRAAAFVGGLMNARNRLVLFCEHDRLKNDWRTIAVAYSSQQHPFTSHM